MRVEKPEVGKMYWNAAGFERGTYWLDGDTFHGWTKGSDGSRYPIWGKLSEREFFDADPTKPAIDLTKRWKFRNGQKVTRINDDKCGTLRAWTTAVSWVPCDLDGKARSSWSPDYDLIPDDEPLPALDLTKPVKRLDGKPVRNVRMRGALIAYEYFVNNEWIGCDAYKTGRATSSGEDHIADLLQCTRRDWTAADVPFPWPVFRKVAQPGTTVSAEWFTVDGIALHAGFGWINWEVLARDWQYTTDGKTWQECCKWE